MTSTLANTVPEQIVYKSVSGKSLTRSIAKVVISEYPVVIPSLQRVGAASMRAAGEVATAPRRSAVNFLDCMIHENDIQKVLRPFCVKRQDINVIFCCIRATVVCACSMQTDV